MAPITLGLILNSVVVAVIIHALIPSYLKASAASAVVSALNLVINASALNGYVEKFVLLAFMITGGYAFVISLLVGLIFVGIRRSRPA